MECLQAELDLSCLASKNIIKQLLSKSNNFPYLEILYVLKGVEREKLYVCMHECMWAIVYMCVHICVSNRERERKRNTERDRGSSRLIKRERAPPFSKKHLGQFLNMFPSVEMSILSTELQNIRDLRHNREYFSQHGAPPPILMVLFTPVSTLMTV